MLLFFLFQNEDGKNVFMFVKWLKIMLIIFILKIDNLINFGTHAR